MFGTPAPRVTETWATKAALSFDQRFANVSGHNRMTSLQVFYEGNVQGVGFRWTVRHIATGFEVTGSVRNLADGRVEMQVSGEENEVRAFLEAVKQSELRGLIKKHTESNLPEPVVARGFEIRHD
jgi:acylphosphatase